MRNTVNASEHDAVIFTGSGCTGAVHKLIHALDFKEPPVSRYKFKRIEDIHINSEIKFNI